MHYVHRYNAYAGSIEIIALQHDIPEEEEREVLTLCYVSFLVALGSLTSSEH